MPTITLSRLREANACKDQCDLFQETFGDSVEVTVKAAVKVASNFDWVWAAQLLDEPAKEAYDAATATG